MITRFRDEEKRQAEHCARVLAKMEHDKKDWFKSGTRANLPDTRMQQLSQAMPDNMLMQ